MTPNGIQILLHCYYSPTPHPRLHAPAVKEEIQSFLTNGLIESDLDNPGVYRCTPRGAAHVSQLCSLPWPTQAWIGADGKVIE
jgi:hypothetical protein